MKIAEFNLGTKRFQAVVVRETEKAVWVKVRNKDGFEKTVKRERERDRVIVMEDESKS